jgi:hypothetical protein
VCACVCACFAQWDMCSDYVCINSNGHKIVLGGLVISVVAIGIKVCGFKPDRGRWIFKGDKENPQHVFLRRGSKPSSSYQKILPRVEESFEV